MNYLLLTFILLFSSGCVAKSNITGMLGFSENRRVVIIGERVPPSLAEYYQKKYEALVWFTPSEGKIVDSADHVLKGFGPSYAMQALIAELKSINQTVGRWEIIVPKIAESYFLATLKNMETGALEKARGTIVLIDSKGNSDIEEQIKRVANENFFVTYEFQKY